MKQERALMRLLKLNKLILGYSFNNLNDLKITWLDNSTTVLDQNGKVVMSSKTDQIFKNQNIVPDEKERKVGQKWIKEFEQEMENK
jgi:hypothetical protein